jgi:hypothetical protein
MTPPRVDIGDLISGVSGLRGDELAECLLGRRGVAQLALSGFDALADVFIYGAVGALSN